MSARRKILCGVPFEHCSGGLTSTDQIVQNRKSFRAHSTRPEAFACMRRYLLKQGCVQLGAREFQKDGGPVLLLTKKSHYGGLFVLGKNSEKGGGQGKRFMPERRRNGNRGVVIG